MEGAAPSPAPAPAAPEPAAAAGVQPTHEELFQCLVCLGRPQDAQLLRCCVKIVCRECIERWLTNRRQCPHCREPLYQSQLTNWCASPASASAVRDR